MQMSELFFQIEDELSEEQKQELQIDMKSIKGILAAKFSKKQEGKFLILFDADQLELDFILKELKEFGYNIQFDE